MKLIQMGIGLKITQKINNSKDNINNNTLSIHINENWVVFCLFSQEKLIDIDKVVFLAKKTPTFLLKTIKKYIKSITETKAPKAVKLIYYDNSSTLVPSVLFDEKNSLNFLKYNTNIKINDLAANDSILNNEVTNVFIPYVNINNYIFDKFKTFDFFHYSSLLIQLLSLEISDNFSEKIFLNLNDGFIDILYFKNKKLEFYNTFDNSCNEDILYYLLFCLNQLNLNPDKTHVACSGNISLDSKIYELLYTYVRNVELLNFDEIEGVNSDIIKSNILFRNF